MPRSRRPTHYGPEYEQLLLRAFAERGLSFDLPSPAHCLSFRGKVYSYFKALHTANTRPDLIAMADALSLSCSGPTFSIYPVEDSWDNCLLREVLDLQKGAPLPDPNLPPPEPTAQDKLKAKLQELRDLRTSGGGKKEEK